MDPALLVSLLGQAGYGGLLVADGRIIATNELAKYVFAISTMLLLPAAVFLPTSLPRFMPTNLGRPSCTPTEHGPWSRKRSQ